MSTITIECRDSEDEVEKEMDIFSDLVRQDDILAVQEMVSVKEKARSEPFEFSKWLIDVESRVPM